MMHGKGMRYALSVLLFAVCSQADRISEQHVLLRLDAIANKTKQGQNAAAPCGSGGAGSRDKIDMPIGLAFVLPGCGEENACVSTLITRVVKQLNLGEKAKIAVVAPGCAATTCSDKPEDVILCHGDKTNFQSCLEYVTSGDTCKSTTAPSKEVDFGEFDSGARKFKIHTVVFRLKREGSDAVPLKFAGQLAFDITYDQACMISIGDSAVEQVIGEKYGMQFKANFDMIGSFVRVQQVLPGDDDDGHVGSIDSCEKTCAAGVYNGRPELAASGGGEKPEDGDEGFAIRMRRWQLVLSMANRLEPRPFEDGHTLQIKTDFFENSKSIMARVLGDDSADAGDVGIAKFDPNLKNLKSAADVSVFVRLMRPLLYVVSQIVGVPGASALDAEYQIMMSRNHNKKEIAARTEDIVRRMREFIVVTRYIECAVPLFAKETWAELWSAWQMAQGSVRVFVRISMQCAIWNTFDDAAELRFSGSGVNSVGFSRGSDNDGFFPQMLMKDDSPPSDGWQRLWHTCGGALKWDPTQWPAACLSCSRNDDLDLKRQTGGVPTDTLVRWLGCGQIRDKKTDKTFGNVPEPLFEEGGLRQYCKTRGSGTTNNWNQQLCSQTKTDKCNIFGPFWAVYSPTAYRAFGVKNEIEENMLTNEGFTRIDDWATIIDDTAIDVEKAVFAAKCHCPSPVLGEPCPAGRQNKVTGDHTCGVDQVETFKALSNEASAAYVYGTNPQVPGFYPDPSMTGEGDPSIGPKRRMTKPYYSMPYDRPSDPPLREMLEEVQNGGTVIMMAYGFSGAGKTTTLIGNSNPKVEGVLTHFLKEKARSLARVHLVVAEVYGRVDVSTGNFVPQSGTGMWVFNVDGELAKPIYLGGYESFTDDRGKTSLPKMKELLFANKDPSKRARKTIEAAADINAGIQQSLDAVEKTRKDTRLFSDLGLGIAHIRATANNPTSSRGALFVIIDMEFKAVGNAPPVTGTVVVLDLAGAEDPAEMLKGFASMKSSLGGGDVLQTTNARSCCDALNVATSGKILCDEAPPSGGVIQSQGCRGDIQFRQNLHRVNSTEYYDTPDGQCLTIKDFAIKECGLADLSGCTWMKMPGEAEDKWYKADSSKVAGLLSKAGASSDQDENVKFDIAAPTNGIICGERSCGCQGQGRGAAFESSSQGQFTLSDIRKQIQLEVMQAEKTRERYGGDKGHCTFLQDWENKEQTAKGTSKYSLIKDSAWYKGEVTQNNEDSKKTWMADKKTCSHETQKIKKQEKCGQCYEQLKDSSVDSLKKFLKAGKGGGATGGGAQVEFQRHMKFFVSVAANLVQEAVYINELLNQLKFWIKGRGVVTGPHSGQSEVAQILSFDPSRDATDPYNPGQLIQAKEDPKKLLDLAEEDKLDKLLGISMLKMLEERARDTAKATAGAGIPPRDNFWILFGTFARTDKPNGDPDCLGARRALQFGHQLLPQTAQDAQLKIQEEGPR